MDLSNGIVDTKRVWDVAPFKQEYARTNQDLSYIQGSDPRRAGRR